MADVLAIDFGTSNTVAMVSRSGGPAEPLLFDGSPLLPSAVYAQPDGTLVTGRDAVHSARLAPHRFEPNPKLRVDDGAVLLGLEVPVVDLFAAVLGRVAAESAHGGGRPRRVVLTHPASWGPRRRQVLRSAAELAGLSGATLVPEPVAAAIQLARARGKQHPGPVVVYDLGAGTFDVSVVDAGTVVAAEGLPDVGGLDIDTTLLAYLQATYRDRDPAAWDRLRRPGTADDRRAWRQLTDDVRAAKEMLSRAAQTFVHIPLVDVDAPISREQVEAVAEPLLARTVAATRAAVAAAGLPLPPPGPVCLVGGGSRMPLVATMLHRRFGTAPILAEQPELVVARGALDALPGSSGETRSGGPPVRRTRPAATRRPAVDPANRGREDAGARDPVNRPADAAAAAPAHRGDRRVAGGGPAQPGAKERAGSAARTRRAVAARGGERVFGKSVGAVWFEYGRYGVLGGLAVAVGIMVPTAVLSGDRAAGIAAAAAISVVLMVVLGLAVPALEVAFGGVVEIAVSADGITETERTRRGRVKASVRVGWDEIRTVCVSRGSRPLLSMRLRADPPPGKSVRRDRRYADDEIFFGLGAVAAAPRRAARLDEIERAVAIFAGDRLRPG